MREKNETLFARATFSPRSGKCTGVVVVTPSVISTVKVETKGRCPLGGTNEKQLTEATPRDASKSMKGRRAAERATERATERADERGPCRIVRSCTITNKKDSIPTQSRRNTDRSRLS